MVWDLLGSFAVLEESFATRHAVPRLGEPPKDHRDKPTTRSTTSKPIKTEGLADASAVPETMPKPVTKSPIVTPKTVCKYWLAEYLQVPWPNYTNVPVCTNASPCNICPHQDFATYSKADLLIFVNKCKHEFHKHSTWAVMHDLCLEAVGNMA